MKCGARGLGLSEWVKHTGIVAGGGVGSSMEFRHRNRSFSIEMPDDGALELYVDGCLRKSRVRGQREPQYVWTNIELEWEEHQYIEARYWASSQALKVTVNGETIFEGTAVV